MIILEDIAVQTKQKAQTKTLRNKAFAQRLASDYPEFTIQEYEDLLKIVFFTIEDLVSEGDTLRLDNSCTFYPKQNKPRKTVHPITGDEMQIEESVTLGVKVSVAMNTRIKQMFKKQETQETQEVPEAQDTIQESKESKN